MKRVLVLCTGNSCRSIIAEALINAELEGFEAHSAGVNPSGRVNPNAQKVLEQAGIWEARYRSKSIEEVITNNYDLIVTVCDHAKETCPVFPKPTPTLHVGFDDPDGKAYEAFEATYQAIKTKLLPQIKAYFKTERKHTMDKNVIQTDQGVAVHFTGEVKKTTIVQMVQNCATGQCECMSDATKAKISDMNVQGDDGEVTLRLHGEVTKAEIEAALAKSKVINPK